MLKDFAAKRRAPENAVPKTTTLTEHLDEKGIRDTSPALWRSMWLLLASFIGAAAASGLAWLLDEQVRKALKGTIDEVVKNQFCYVTLVGLSLLFALLASNAVRKWLKNYVGDLAVYLSSHKASKFFKARDEIQKAVCDVLRDVYDMRDSSGNKLYKDVVLIGHSLGSVVLYDTLDSLIREEASVSIDATSERAKRTRMLLTCGSPLDKVAYLFSSRTGKNDEIRDGLSTAVQPLILDEKYRPRRWVNIWSRRDPISYKLGYYDFADAKPSNDTPKFSEVLNLLDRDATIPFAAHSHYFENPLLRNVLLSEILTKEFSEPPEPESGPPSAAPLTKQPVAPA
jgi:hypothetical protein